MGQTFGRGHSVLSQDLLQWRLLRTTYQSIQFIQKSMVRTRFNKPSYPETSLDWGIYIKSSRKKGSKVIMCTYLVQVRARSSAGAAPWSSQVEMSRKVSRPSKIFSWSSSGEPEWTLYIILCSLFWINACVRSSASGDHASGNWVFGETPFHCQLDKIASHVGERTPGCLTARCTYTLPCMLTPHVH